MCSEPCCLDFKGCGSNTIRPDHALEARVLPPGITAHKNFDPPVLREPKPKNYTPSVREMLTIPQSVMEKKTTIRANKFTVVDKSVGKLRARKFGCRRRASADDIHYKPSKKMCLFLHKVNSDTPHKCSDLCKSSIARGTIDAAADKINTMGFLNRYQVVSAVKMYAENCSSVEELVSKALSYLTEVGAEPADVSGVSSLPKCYGALERQILHEVEAGHLPNIAMKEAIQQAAKDSNFDFECTKNLLVERNCKPVRNFSEVDDPNLQPMSQCTNQVLERRKRFCNSKLVNKSLDNWIQKL